MTRAPKYHRRPSCICLITLIRMPIGNSWSGFSRLQQFASWKAPVAEYHTGVRDNYYYELQAAIFELARGMKLASQKVAGLHNVLQTLDQEARAALFDMNPTAFGEQIERLLRESELLLTQENEFKEQLSEFNSRRALHKSRLDMRPAP